MATLAIDLGTHIVGILTDRGRYSPYTRHNNEVAIRRALRRITRTDVLVTFLGSNFNDLDELRDIAKLTEPFPLRGQLFDMRAISYADGYCGMKLYEMYEKRFGSLPEFPNTYEGNNHRDCFMTLALYKAWRKGELAVRNPHLGLAPGFNAATTSRAKGPTT